MSKKFYDTLPETEDYCDLSLQNYTASSQCATCHRNVQKLENWMQLKQRTLLVHSTEEFNKAEKGNCPYYL